MKNLKIGSHVSMSGKEMMLGSVKEAASYNSDTFMIYTGAPQNTRRKPIDELRIEEAHKLMKEKNINDGNIKNAVDYIVLNEAGEKIFLIADPSKRISLGGYTLLNDEIKINAFNFVNIHFKKKITIKDKNYLILATIKYEVGSSRDLGSLYNGVLTRMWIKEDV